MVDGGTSGSKTKPLLGTDEATIDSKGRILVSKKKRERLGETFAMAVGEVGCLTAYPEDKWERIVAELDQYDPSNPGRQQYTRLVLGTAEDELKFDQQGRVVVPSKLRELVGLKDEVLLVGCGDRLEIWDPKEFKDYQDYPDTYGQKRREAIEKARAKMVTR